MYPSYYNFRARPDVAHCRYMATTYTIDFTTPDTEPWFRRTGQFPSTRRILGLEGSRLVSTDETNTVRVANIESGTWMCALKVPLIHADPTLRLPVRTMYFYIIFSTKELTLSRI